MEISVLFITIFLVNLLFIFKFNHISNFINLFDKPNRVKIHKENVPCFGGLIFFINIILFGGTLIYLYKINFINFDFFQSKRSQFSFFLISSLFLVLGFLDDKFKISSNQKLFLQFFLIITALLIDQNLVITNLKFSNSIEIHLFNLSIIFSILCFLIFINAFNMFDGINNQIALYNYIFCVFLYLNNFNLILIMIILFSNIIFSYLNLKGKIFLGDNGTLFLSYIFSYLLVKGYNFQIIDNALDIVVLMFFPVIDLVRLFFLRLIKNIHPFHGDKTHLHHLLLMKYGLKKTNFFISISIILPIFLIKINVYLALILSLSLYIYLIKISKKNV